MSANTWRLRSCSVLSTLFTWVRMSSSTVGIRTSKPISGFMRSSRNCITTSTGTRFL